MIRTLWKGNPLRMSSDIPDNLRRQNRPLATMLVGVLLLALAGALLLIVPDAREDELGLILGVIVLAVPGLLAAGYAERTNRDVRNGVLTEKARQGAQRAMDDVGVTDVVNATQRGATTVTQLAALGQLVDSDATKRDALAVLLRAVLPDNDPTGDESSSTTPSSTPPAGPSPSLPKRLS